MPKTMTKKMKVFCEEYVKHWNATKAALNAGYSKKTAYSIGHENLKKPEIVQHIEELKQDLEKYSGVSALRNLQELAKLAYSNIGTIQKDWYTLEEWDQLTDEDKAAISQVRRTRRIIRRDNKEVETEVVEVKLHSKRESLEAINRMMGYNQQEDQAPSEIVITVRENVIS